MTKPDPTKSDLKRDQKKQMKSAARFYAVQALFQMESSGQTVEACNASLKTTVLRSL